MADNNRELLETVLVPVANGDDARATARELEPYQPDRVIALHVIEKGEGVMDKIPPTQSMKIADESFAAIREVFPGVEDRTAFGRNIARIILEEAATSDASAIVFRVREGNRLTQFLSGDLAIKLITSADRPVIALPRRNAV